MATPRVQDRAEPHRTAAHRDRAHRAVQLPVRAPDRRHVRPADGGHRRRADHPGVRGGHPRGPALARDRVGRGPGQRRRRRPRPVRAVPADAAPASATARPPPSLLARDQAYPCYCTPEELDADRKAQEAAHAAAALRRSMRDSHPRGARRPRGGGPPRRDPLPRHRRQGRLRRPRPRRRVEIDTSTLGGDFVIVRSDGTPLYHFVVVVDDAAMEMTHIIRGEDHISNTPKHILLFRALGAEVPAFAHLPLILNPDRTKMSKRKSQTAIADYRAQGFLPEALVNFLALLGWSTGTEEEILTLGELVGAVRPRARPQGRRRLRPGPPRVAERPVDPQARARGPRRAARCRSSRPTGPAGRIDRVPDRRGAAPARPDHPGAPADARRDRRPVDFLWQRARAVDPAMLVPKRWDAATTLAGAARGARRRSPTSGASRSRPTSSSRRCGPRRGQRLEGRRPVHGRSASRRPAEPPRRPFSIRSSPSVASACSSGSTPPSTPSTDSQETN